MLPDEVLTRFYREKVNRQEKITFFSSLVFGFAAHLFMLVNKLPNYDDIHCLLDDYGSGIEVGRWMLFILGNIVRKTIGSVSIPWLNGLICIIILSITAAVIVHILEFKSNVLCCMIGAVIISFPAVTGTLFFMYTAVYYCTAALCMVLAVLAIKNDQGKGMFIAVFWIAAGIGIYQAYFAWAVSFTLIWLLSEGLKDSSDAQRILKLGIKSLVTLLIGLIAYLIGVRFFLAVKGVELSGYQNLDQMTKLDPSIILGQILYAYRAYIALFFKDVAGINTIWILKAVFLTLHIIVFILLVLCLKKKNQKYVVMEVIGIAAIFPIAVNLIYIIGVGSHVYTIMMFSVVSIYLLLGTVMNHSDVRGKVAAAGTWGGLCLLFMAAVCQIQYSNVQYLILNMQYEQAVSYFTTMVSQIKSLDGYDPALKLAFIGSDIKDPSFTYNKEFSSYPIGGRGEDLINVYSREDFLKRYLGYDQEILSDYSYLEASKDVQDMPSYPASGSLKIVDDIIVIKLD